MESITQNYDVLSMYRNYLGNEMWCTACISKYMGSQNATGDTALHLNNFTED